jgi:SAM-dependent methyltransferase
MRYKLNGVEIRTENTAKPMVRASKSLTDWILSRPQMPSALDYGCGKLRYTPYLARRCNKLGLVDSPIQLRRSQIIAGQTSTVERYASARWRSCKIYTVEEFWNVPRERFDLVLCANVLSAIPSRKLRARSLRAIKGCLKPGGACLVVNQHRNSYFGRARNRSEATDHLDGWILASAKSTTYYGILSCEKTKRILRAIGFRILEVWIDGESSFVLAGGAPK